MPFYNQQPLYELGALIIIHNISLIDRDLSLNTFCQTNCKLLTPQDSSVFRFASSIQATQHHLLVGAPFTHTLFDTQRHRFAGALYIYSL
jgi:hypothetical protein